MPAKAAALRENVALQNDFDVESEYLNHEGASVYCPKLHTEDFVRDAYFETDGYLDHHCAVQGYREAALDAGVEMRTGTPVVGLRCRDGCAVGVDTPMSTSLRSISSRTDVASTFATTVRIRPESADRLKSVTAKRRRP